jgi:hypothetical protein
VLLSLLLLVLQLLLLLLLHVGSAVAVVYTDSLTATTGTHVLLGSSIHLHFSGH